MNANINFQQVVGVAKSLVGIASLVMICIGVLRAFGVHLPYVTVQGTELAALAASAAYISK